MSDYTLNVTSREDLGKGASRRLRRLADQVPAVIYGAKKDAQSIALLQKEFAHALENEGFYSQVIELSIDGNAESVILKDVQRHPAKAIILHADFLRIDKTQKLTIRAPLHFINEETSVGVKLQGGVVTHNMTELEISCLPADLPEYIEVDMAEVEVDQTVHISDLKLPEGVESVALAHGDDHDLPIAAIHIPKAAPIEDELEATEEGEEGEGDTPDSADEGDQGDNEE